MPRNTTSVSGQYQLISTTSIVKRTLEDVKAATEPSEKQLRIRRQDRDLDKFALRDQWTPSGEQSL